MKPNVIKRAIIWVLIAAGVCLIAMVIFFTAFYDGPAPVYYTLSYGVVGEGDLEGERLQTVQEEQNGSPILAVAAEGWHFTGWSDGYSDEMRIDYKVSQDKAVKAIFEEGPPESQEIERIQLYFYAQKGGRIEGELYQDIPYGQNGSTVVAIPDEGYRFKQWSDGETDAVRKNLCITSQPQDFIYAEFERYSRLFTYHYNEATSTNTEETVLITLDNLDSIRLPVPDREGYRFKGWYSDWYQILQVSDESGKIIVGKEWLQGEWWYDEPRHNPENQLYAKWEAVKEVPKYKILIACVTEVHGIFETNHAKTDRIKVDFKMSEYQKTVCLKIAERFETYLDAMLNATVDFEVDTYFTTEPLSRENFYVRPDEPDTSYGINVEYGAIPEINEMIGNYRSVMTIYCLNDYYDELGVHCNAAAKYGEVSLEDLMNESDGGYSDETNPWSWQFEMQCMIDLFTETVDLQLDNADRYRLDRAESYYADKMGVIDKPFLILGLYLRGEFETEEGKVGIPYSFWEGTYESKNNG